ncbi:MAG: hypothetical protein ACI8O8_000577 [Oleiphilaceae bacterium]
MGYPVVDLTDNEIAKIHIRHMVVGEPLVWVMSKSIALNFLSDQAH